MCMIQEMQLSQNEFVLKQMEIINQEYVPKQHVDKAARSKKNATLYRHQGATRISLIGEFTTTIGYCNKL